jgi:ABC-type branched-subunit amino acid transport system permease subunit
MAYGSVPGAIAGVILLKVLERDLGSSFETVIFTALGAVLILTGAAMLALVLLTQPHARPGRCRRRWANVSQHRRVEPGRGFDAPGQLDE